MTFLGAANYNRNEVFMSTLIGSLKLQKLFSRTLLAVMICLLSTMGSAAAAEVVRNPDLSTAIIQVARQAIPAVTHIEVTESQEVANPFLPFSTDPFFRRFFNTPPDMPKKFKREMKGLGTGMIIDARGHILTNYHVAGGAKKIEVLLSDGRRYPAELIGSDPKTDLAVIKISVAGDLPYVTFGDSDKVEVGQWVVAIGHPRGLDQTVTQGIISAKHRQGISDPGSYQDFLQTDAAINPGSSGGPLLNLQGEVIGVNAVIVSESGGFEGIGFTIPSNMAVFVSRALIAHGKVERGWLGITIRELTPELAKSAGAENVRGALIADVVVSGPAQKAGLKKNDVVVAYDGKEISDSGILRNEVAATPVGREVKITYIRNGKRQELMLRVGSLELSAKLMAEGVKQRLGAEVRLVSSAEVKKYGLDSSQGVRISWIDPKGSLGLSGLEVGDIILGVENRPIENPEGFIELMNTLPPNQKITLFVIDHRSGNMGNILVTVK
jgi:serine protease Do